MSFRTDNGGSAISISDVKLMSSCSTWNTRLSQIAKQKGQMIICTYSLPGLQYIGQIFNKKSDNVILIAHEKFFKQAQILQRQYPNLKIYLKPKTHAKMVLIEPCTVWLSSANFGRSNWFEHCIGFHSKKVYDFYRNEIAQNLGV